MSNSDSKQEQKQTHQTTLSYYHQRYKDIREKKQSLDSLYSEYTSLEAAVFEKLQDWNISRDEEKAHRALLKEIQEELTRIRTKLGIKETEQIFSSSVGELKKALLRAIESNNLGEVINIIEQNIIDIDSKLVLDDPVIWVAASSPDPNIFEYLLSKNPNLEIPGLSHHILRAQWDSKKKEKILATLVERGLPPVEHHFQAAALGHLDILKECKKAELTQKNPQGLTLLHFSAMNGKLETVQWLVEVGLKINEKDDFGNTAPMFAARYGHLDTLKFLVKRRKGDNILQTVKLLFAERGKLTNTTTGDYNFLHYAAIYGQLDVVKWLFKKGIKATDRTESGETPFLLAAGNGHVNIVKWFLEEGHAKITECIPSYNITALLVAAKFNRVEVVYFLLTKGGAKVNECDHEQSTALHHAARFGYLELVKLLTSDSIKANVHARDNQGNTPLILAVRHGFLNIARHLLLNGANVRDRDNKGRTLLHEAVYGGFLPMIKFVLSQPGINIHQRDKKGNTALLEAWRNKGGMDKVLIKNYGANPFDLKHQGEPTLFSHWTGPEILLLNEEFLNHRKKQYSEMAKLILDNATSEFLIPPPLRNIIYEYLINPNPITSTELAEILPEDFQDLQPSATKPSDIIFGYAIDPPEFEEEDSFWEHLKASADNLLEPLIKYADINEGLSRRLLEEIYCDYPYDARMIRRVVQVFSEKYREEINSTLSEILNVIIADTSYLETPVRQIAAPEEFSDAKEEKQEKQLEKAPLSIKDKPTAHFARVLNSPKPALAPTSPTSNDKEEEGFNFVSYSEKS